MDDESAGKAITALRDAWPYQPISAGQERIWRRLLLAWDVETTRSVIDDFVNRGIVSRPGPAEFVSLIRTKKRVEMREETCVEDHPRTPFPAYLKQQLEDLKNRNPVSSRSR